MAKLTMKLGEVSRIAQAFMQNWETMKQDMHLSAVGMYSVLGIRNTAISEFRKIQEAAMEFGRSVGGVEQPNGSLKLPDDKIDEVNRHLDELQSQDYEFEYTPLTISKDDNISFELMELLFNFIDLKRD